jgi:hypothetical protein
MMLHALLDPAVVLHLCCLLVGMLLASMSTAQGCKHTDASTS